ncbi:unnamed protein product [Chondrus crispus]|uniref:Uncharacterized protein n=1 Tax=Chondrus crispus TaxID=2769 RepID=R7QLC5_CHOCR|nr:unnamed protein product [Chondrus crispus]CDF39317.1 unnamed protein product [Chondrus crispus]|eukprot:XP_005719228.1 unnamed protein product [Chondrus crispus]
MSGISIFLRKAWANEPVVCFSIVIGAVGLSLPCFVPKLWGRYPDKIQTDERSAMTEAARLQALERSGLL